MDFYYRRIIRRFPKNIIKNGAEISRMKNTSLLQAHMSNNHAFKRFFTVVKRFQLKYFFFNAVSRTSVLNYVTLLSLNSDFDRWIWMDFYYRRIIRRFLKNITKNECRNIKDGECRISVASVSNSTHLNASLLLLNNSNRNIFFVTRSPVSRIKLVY